MKKFISAASVAAMVAASALTALPAAAVQTGAGPGSIVNCDVSGNRQANGAILGAIAGAVVGNNVSHGKNAPIIGAVAGAAAGSYVGCQQQRQIAERRGEGAFYATTNVNVRSGPSTGYGRVGSLYRGQQVSVTGYQGNWAVVDMGNNRSGFVSASYLQPAN